jgi:hypothetical protein
MTDPGDYTTVFQISLNSNGEFADLVFRLIVGLAAIVGGIVVLVFGPKKNKKYKGLSVLLLSWGIGWSALHNFPHWYDNLSGLLSAYENGRYEVVEGPVKVLRRQPAGGHSAGDLVEVNGIQFEVNYFLGTSAYRTTISHGGVLIDGAYARIFHNDGKILRVDLRSPR